MRTDPRRISKQEIEASKSLSLQVVRYIEERFKSYVGTLRATPDEVLEYRRLFLRACFELSPNLLKSLKEDIVPVCPDHIASPSPWGVERTKQRLKEAEKYFPKASEIEIPKVEYPEYWERLVKWVKTYNLGADWIMASLHHSIMNWKNPELDVFPLMVCCSGPLGIGFDEGALKIELPGWNSLGDSGTSSLHRPDNPQTYSNVSCLTGEVVKQLFDHIEDGIENALLYGVGPLRENNGTIQKRMKHLAKRVIFRWSASAILQEEDENLDKIDIKNRANELYKYTNELAEIVGIVVPEAIRSKK